MNEDFYPNTTEFKLNAILHFWSFFSEKITAISDSFEANYVDIDYFETVVLCVFAFRFLFEMDIINEPLKMRVFYQNLRFDKVFKRNLFKKVKNSDYTKQIKVRNVQAVQAGALRILASTFGINGFIFVFRPGR